MKGVEVLKGAGPLELETRVYGTLIPALWGVGATSGQVGGKGGRVRW